MWKMQVTISQLKEWNIAISLNGHLFNFKVWFPPELTKYKMTASFVPVLDSFHWHRITKRKFLGML